MDLVKFWIWCVQSIDVGQCFWLPKSNPLVTSRMKPPSHLSDRDSLSERHSEQGDQDFGCRVGYRHACHPVTGLDRRGDVFGSLSEQGRMAKSGGW